MEQENKALKKSHSKRNQIAQMGSNQRVRNCRWMPFWPKQNTTCSNSKSAQKARSGKEPKRANSILERNWPLQGEGGEVISALDEITEIEADGREMRSERMTKNKWGKEDMIWTEKRWIRKSYLFFHCFKLINLIWINGCSSWSQSFQSLCSISNWLKRVDSPRTMKPALWCLYAHMAPVKDTGAWNGCNRLMRMGMINQIPCRPPSRSFSLSVIHRWESSVGRLMESGLLHLPVEYSSETKGNQGRVE